MQCHTAWLKRYKGVLAALPMSCYVDGRQASLEPGNRQQVETDRLSKLPSAFNTVLIDTESLIIVCSGRLKVRALETPVSWLLNSITYLCML